ncbi:hypothetical protein IWQ62_003347, partial [Dispira parvispora]
MSLLNSTARKLHQVSSSLAQWPPFFLVGVGLATGGVLGYYAGRYPDNRLFALISRSSRQSGDPHGNS